MRFGIFIAFAIALYVSAIVMVFRALFDKGMLVDELNLRLPPEIRRSQYVGSWQHYEFRRLYRRHLPESSRLKRNDRLWISAMTLMLLAFLFLYLAGIHWPRT